MADNDTIREALIQAYLQGQRDRAQEINLPETAARAIMADTFDKPEDAPEGKDFIVRTLAVIMVRAESMLDEEHAITWVEEIFEEQRIRQILEEAIDPTDFYIVVENDEWTAEED